MKWVFDWKCSLYSLTVCLDSMSPFLIYFLSILLSFFSHILYQWYFPYLRITGQNKNINRPITFTSAVREPGTEEKEYSGGWHKSNDKLASLFFYFVDDSRWFLVGKQLAQWDEKKKTGIYARLPLGLTYNGGGTQLRCSVFLAGSFLR